jgi:hypothetical protein
MPTYSRSRYKHLPSSRVTVPCLQCCKQDPVTRPEHTRPGYDMLEHVQVLVREGPQDYKTPFVLGTSVPPVRSAAWRIASASALNADSALARQLVSVDDGE